MTYTATLKSAIGKLRGCLERAGLGRRDERFAQHGTHTPAGDAPLVLVACSGGRDSLALAALAHIVCGTLGLRCGAMIIDHRMQEGSAGVAAQAASTCVDLGLDPVIVRIVHVNQDGNGPEAAARDARYEAMFDEARACGAQAILLAHTRDDQAETIIMGLMRSGGVDVLDGMRECNNRYDDVMLLRPFLGITREQTTAICRDLGISWWDDPTNGDHISQGERLPRDYPLRSRIRHDLMPLLDDIAGGDMAGHLAQYTDIAARDRDYLESKALVVYDSVVTPEETGGSLGCSLDAKAMFSLPAAIRIRVIAMVCANLGIAASIQHIESIERLIVDWHGQGVVSLPSGYQAFRKKHVIRVCQDSGHENR